MHWWKEVYVLYSVGLDRWVYNTVNKYLTETLLEFLKHLLLHASLGLLPHLLPLPITLVGSLILPFLSPTSPVSATQPLAVLTMNATSAHAFISFQLHYCNSLL